MDLTTPTLTLAELYTITTVNGDIARFTSLDKDVVYGGNTFQAIPISRSQISYHTDLQVDKVDISMGLVGILIGTTHYSIPKLIQLGLMRNAHVLIHLVDYVALDAVQLLFEGWVTEGVSYNRGVCTLSVGSLLDKLNEKFPKYMYSDYCQHQLYGPYCGLSKATYLETGSALTGSTKSLLAATVFSYSNHATPYWMKGEIKMTSGANNGTSRSIIVHGDGNVVFLIPFVETIAIGDTFEAYPGCDKAGVTCDEKFNNYVNFFGFEYCPKPEVLIG
jgi:uncharacterized phage protein (TIGR02218 family)